MKQTVIEEVIRRNSYDALLNACTELLGGGPAATMQYEPPEWFQTAQDLVRMTAQVPDVFAEWKTIVSCSEKVPGTSSFRRVQVAKALAVRGAFAETMVMLPEKEVGADAWTCTYLCGEPLPTEALRMPAECVRFIECVLLPCAAYSEASSILQQVGATTKVRLMLALALAEQGIVEELPELPDTREYADLILMICEALIHFGALDEATGRLRLVNVNCCWADHEPQRQRYVLCWFLCNGFDGLLHLLGSFSVNARLYAVRALYAACRSAEAHHIFNTIQRDELKSGHEVISYLFAAYQVGIELPDEVSDDLFERVRGACGRDAALLHCRWLMASGRVEEAEAATEQHYAADSTLKDGYANLGGTLLTSFMGWLAPELLWCFDPATGCYRIDPAGAQDRAIAGAAREYFQRDFDSGRLSDFRWLQLVRLSLATGRLEEAAELFFSKPVYRVHHGAQQEMYSCAKQFILAGMLEEARRVMAYTGSIWRLPRQAPCTGFIVEHYLDAVSGKSTGLPRFADGMKRWPPDAFDLSLAMLTYVLFGDAEACLKLYDSFVCDLTRLGGVIVSNIKRLHGSEKIEAARGPFADMTAALACLRLGKKRRLAELRGRIPEELRQVDHVPPPFAEVVSELFL
jgi:hypothetical protein